MNLSAPFIRRPVATTLLSFGLVVAGMVAFFKLPVSPLPDVDIPTISVQATLPGASPADVATTVASPLERRLGQIASVTEMTSASSLGSARINLQFDIGRDINGAARDVQAAINAARADLPTNLRNNPSYRKFNPASAPILIYTLTSDTLTPAELYDAASTVLAQKLSQVQGVGEVSVSGGSLPAVRVELIPAALNKYGIGLEDVRAALSSANAHSPKGGIDVRTQRYQIYSNDQARKADDYRSIIVAYRNGAAPVRLTDVGEVIDSVENVRTLGLSNGKPAVMMIVYRQPGANIIQMVDHVKALMPQLRASVPPAINLELAVDRSRTIRASLRDVGITLVIAVILVILVVFAFLRNVRATLVPVVAVSVSLIATFAVMYLLGYSIDIFSLMALTVATGFVVDDAIVVLENITRHIDAGKSRLEATLLGTREVGFTVLSMSVSLIAVFVPILLMGGLVGRLFREFAMTVTVAVAISLVISLTTTPMMCAVLLRGDRGRPHGPLYLAFERFFEMVLNGYRHTLMIALRHPGSVILILLTTLGLNFYLYGVVPKGFVPQQDTGLLIGSIQADQHTSFQLMRRKLTQFIEIVKNDPAVETALGFTGGSGPGPGASTNTGTVFASLKPLGERTLPADQVIGRLRNELAAVAGATLFLQSIGDLGAGGRSGNAAYQYTLQGSTSDELNEWTAKLVAALQAVETLTDVSSDQQNRALQSDVVIDRDAASRLGITISQIDNALYDAFGQRQVSTIYVDRNQYHVIMEVAPAYSQNPESLKEVYVSTSGGSASGSQSTNAIAGTIVSPAQRTSIGSIAANAVRNLATNSIGAAGKSASSTGTAVSTNPETMIPLSTVARFAEGVTPLVVSHQDLLVASTVSFNLAPATSLSTAVAAIETTMQRIGMPASIHGGFAGAAKIFQQSIASEPYLVAAALAIIYISLGMLYESYIHPLTILSTLPSAGVGAVLALMLSHTEFDIIGMIGVILLIGIVKKNAIMMIDFALEAERQRGMSSADAILEACLIRFRPIMMTTMAALFGAIPLMVGMGEGSEFRQPLGIAIFGGLILSQILTLYTTPIVYLYLDRLRHRRRRRIGAAHT